MNKFDEIKEATKGFLSIEVQHAIYRAVLDEVLLQIECPSGFEFFAVFGPTGVGKSTLCHTVGTEALEFFSKDSPPNSGELPVVMVTAPAAPRGRPDWKELFCRILEEINRPLAKAPRTTGFNGGFEASISLGPFFGRGTTQGIRRALREAIAFRKVRLILIDEGQHLTKGLNPFQVAMDMDNLKNLACETNCLIGLLGTYELLPLITASGQLSRRVLPVHYPRYSDKSLRIAKLFDDALAAFIEQMPLDSKEVILENRELLYRRTLGCVGTLATMLGRICWRTLRLGNGRVTAEIIKNCALKAGCSRRIESETLRGEAQWFKLLDDSPDLAVAEMSVDDADGVPSNAKPVIRPGRCRPRRDAVGVL